MSSVGMPRGPAQSATAPIALAGIRPLSRPAVLISETSYHPVEIEDPHILARESPSCKRGYGRAIPDKETRFRRAVIRTILTAQSCVHRLTAGATNCTRRRDRGETT